MKQHLWKCCTAYSTNDAGRIQSLNKISCLGSSKNCKGQPTFHSNHLCACSCCMVKVRRWDDSREIKIQLKKLTNFHSQRKALKRVVCIVAVGNLLLLHKVSKHLRFKLKHVTTQCCSTGHCQNSSGVIINKEFNENVLMQSGLHILASVYGSMGAVSFPSRKRMETHKSKLSAAKYFA